MKTSVIMNLISVLMENDPVLLGLIGLSTLIFIVCALMAVILLMLIMMNYSNAQLIKNPLNKDTIAYQMRDACNINLTRISANYPYGVIMWLLFINLLIIIFAVVRIFNNFSNDDAGNERVENNKKLFGSSKTSAVIIVILFAGVSVLMFGICYLFFSKTKNTINNANQNVTKFNDLVSSSMYTTNAEILKQLRAMPTNTIDITNNIENALTIYFKDTKGKKSEQFVTDLSQLFFTFNLYQHYIEMGVNQNNTAVSSALISVFNTTNIFKYAIGKSSDAKTDAESNGETSETKSSVFTDVDSSSWPAADYLISKYTFIKDYSNYYIQLIQNNDFYTNDMKSTLTPQTLLQAANIASNSSVEASQLANSFNLNASLNSFISMAVWIAIITVLPFVVIWFILSGTAEGSMEILLQKEIDTNADKTIADSNTRLYEIKNTLTSLERRINEDIPKEAQLQSTNVVKGGGNQQNLEDKMNDINSNLKDDMIELEKITIELLDITDKNVSSIKNLVAPVIENTLLQKQELKKEEVIKPELKKKDSSQPYKVQPLIISDISLTLKNTTENKPEEIKISNEPYVKKRQKIDVTIRLTEDSLAITKDLFKLIDNIINKQEIINTGDEKILNIVKNINECNVNYKELINIFKDIKNQYNNK